MMVEVQLLRFYDDEAVGEIRIGPDTYEYIPTPAAELRPDETAKILIGKTVGDGKRDLDCYWVTSYFDGRTECTCGDWRFRKARNWGACKHVIGAQDFGLIREPEPEPAGMEPPF
jgi:hypothetical protein